jgi:hypothetical protein
MSKRAELTLVPAAPQSGPKPPRQLGKHGLGLWNRIHRECVIEDAGSLESLFQICAATDRAERLRAAIDQDGEAIRSARGIRANVLLRDELQCRAFIVRSLKSLGLTLQEVKPAMGRPAKGFGWSGGDD